MTKYTTMLRSFLTAAAVMSLALIARGDVANHGVVCVATATFPDSPCTSSTERITLRTEKGVGEDADYDHAQSLIINVRGPNDAGDMSQVDITTQKSLANSGRSILTRVGGSAAVLPAEEPSPELRQKDAVVIVDAASGVPNLKVDASAGAKSQNAGHVVVVADKLTKLDVVANGYNGLSGETANVDLAKKAILGQPGVPSGIASAYEDRRSADPALALPFDSKDLNNYEASGLLCRNGETAVGEAGSYAYDTADDPGSVPTGINVTAFAREESKRALCQRNPEFTVTQQCQAEKEYSFQAVCRVLPEGRSVRFLKRDYTRWERRLCAGSFESQVRRKIVRTAYVEIVIPGVKSYSGQLTREVTFEETYNIYQKDDDASWTQEKDDGSEETISGLHWRNPFWKQAPNIPIEVSLEVRGARAGSPKISVDNSFNDPASYPTRDPQVSGSPSYNRGVKLTYIPRHWPGQNSEDLYGFRTGKLPVKWGGGGNQTYQVDGCMDLINLQDNSYFAPIGQNATLRDGSKPYTDVVSYYKALDAGVIGFSTEDLKRASIIRVRNCFAYEVVDGVVPSDVARGDWVRADSNGDSLAGGPPVITPADTNPPDVSTCPAGFPNRIGFETFVQFEKENSCYVMNPLDPPTWLKRVKINDLISKGKITEAQVNTDGQPGLSDVEVDNAVRQSDFEVFELYSEQWNVTTGTAATPTDPSRPWQEFSFPVTVSAAEKSALDGSAENRKNFCVEIPETGNNFLTNEISASRLTKAVTVPIFGVANGGEVATPTGIQKKICTNGLRLDNYIANVPRPTCPVETGTRLRVSRFSSKYGDARWQTWSQVPDQIDTPQYYSLRAEYIDTRYETTDIPGQIKTAWTHEIHPGVTLPASGMDVDWGDGPQNVGSFTGKDFPPLYQPSFVEVVNGIEQRKYPGWVRESHLRNKNGGFVTPDTFSPFDGNTLFERANRWCNAEAFAQVGTSFVRGLGAKGILRDAPKRVFAFDFEDVVANQTKGYVGIEIQGTSAFSGFYAQPGIYASVTGTPTAIQLNNTNLGKEAFLAANYPYISTRFAEQCEAGELYNEFTGFCHDPGKPHESKTRTVERVLADGKSKAPWSFALKAGANEILDPNVDRIDQAFSSDLRGLALPAGQIDLVNQQMRTLFQLGLFRPMVKMGDDSFVSRDILMNRPESLGRMALTPGLAAKLDVANKSELCRQSFRMIAVPALAAPVTENSVPLSVNINRNAYLPDDSLFIAIDTSCDSGDLTVLGTVRRFSGTGIDPFDPSDGTVEPVSGMVASRFFAQVDLATGQVVAHFRNGSETTLFKMKNMREAVAAGMSATTGHEKLEIVELSPPRLRDRATEWDTIARRKAGLSWQSKIRTAETPPSQEQGTQPYTCQADFLRDGSWGMRKPADNPGAVCSQPGSNCIPITNGSDSDDCELGSTDCALNDEELSLFTQAVSNSKNIKVTREAATQFTPWSHEIAADAPKNPDFAATRDFGSWTQIEGGRDGASVPGCAIYDGEPASGGGVSTEPDQLLVRSSYDVISPSLKVVDTPLFKIRKPSNPAKDFVVVPLDEQTRRSESCVRWDNITGETCEVFHPTIGGPETNSLRFGGKWQHVFVETKERVAQTCREFEPLPGGGYSAKCKTGKDDFNQPYKIPKGAPRTAFCTPLSCEFQMNVQSFQIEASTPVSGQPGEDGSNSGGATVFCRDCRNINFTAIPGVGGRGSNPVSSERSKILTCVSWNNNPLAPIFSVRNLWSQPFVGGASGQNGRPGDIGGQLQVYSDMSPEAVFMISDPAFWVPKQVADPVDDD